MSWLERVARAYLKRMDRGRRERELMAEVADLKKKVADFAQMAVPRAPGGRQEPAPWVVDRNEYVQHVRGSAYISIAAIAKKIAMQPAKVYMQKADGEEEETPADHPLNVLFKQVNQFHTEFDLWFYTVGWRMSTGDAFLWKARNQLGLPAELWPLPSQWVHAIPDRKEFIRAYKVEGVWGEPEEIDARDIIHIAEPNLNWAATGRYYGWPPMAAAAQMIDLEESMLERLKGEMKNLAPPGMVFAGAEGIGEEQVWELYSILNTQHQMAEDTGRPFVVPEGFTLESGAMRTPREMDYIKSLDAALDHILAIFGVPKAVVGLSRDFNRANYEAAMLSFAENVVNPLLRHHSEHLTQNLAMEFDEKLVIRFDPVTVDDSEGFRKMVESAHKAGAVTPNDARQFMLDWGPFETGGDRPMVQGSWAQAEFGNVPEAELQAEKEEQEAKEAEQRELERERLEAERNGQGDEEEDDGKKKPPPKGKAPKDEEEDEEEDAKAAAKANGEADVLYGPGLRVRRTVESYLQRRWGSLSGADERRE